MASRQRCRCCLRRVVGLGVTSQAAGAAPIFAPIAEAGFPGFGVHGLGRVARPSRNALPVVDRLNAEMVKILASRTPATSCPRPVSRSQVDAEGFRQLHPERDRQARQGGQGAGCQARLNYVISSSPSQEKFMRIGSVEFREEGPHRGHHSGRADQAQRFVGRHPAGRRSKAWR